jgi:hypothetical protein
MASKKLPDRRTLSRAVKDRAARTRRLLEWARGELTDTIRMSEETMQESATGAGLARAHNMLCCCESRMAEVASQLRTKDLREPAYRDGPDALRVVAFALKESYYDRKAWNPMALARMSMDDVAALLDALPLVGRRRKHWQVAQSSPGRPLPRRF